MSALATYDASAMPSGESHAGPQDPLVLLAADEQHPPLVGVASAPATPTQTGGISADSDQIPVRILRALEAQHERGQRGQQRRSEVDDQEQLDVARLPHPAVGVAALQSHRDPVR